MPTQKSCTSNLNSGITVIVNNYKIVRVYSRIGCTPLLTCMEWIHMEAVQLSKMACEDHRYFFMLLMLQLISESKFYAVSTT